MVPAFRPTFERESIAWPSGGGVRPSPTRGEGEMERRTSRLLAGCLLAGALLLGMAGRANANLVANGDFETGDFTGWAQFGDTSFSGVDGTAPQAGSFAAFFGPLT